MSTPGEAAEGNEAEQLAADDGRPSLDRSLLLADVARRFYLQGMTRVEIAQQLEMSRFKVSRLLESAVATGVVKIEIAVPESVDADLSLRLRNKFGIERALVTTTDERNPEAMRNALGRAAAALLTDIVTAEDILGVTSGRTIDAVARNLTSLAGCEIIQLTGMSGDLHDNPVEVLRRVAELSGGQAHSIYAPLTVPNAATAASLKTDPRIATAFARFSSVTIAVAAVGCWDPPDSRFHSALTAGDQQALLDRDVIADVGGALLNTAGEPVHDFDDRVLGISAEELRDAGQVIVVAGGQRKVKAIRATLKAGLVTTLITDAPVAIRLLSDES